MRRAWLALLPMLSMLSLIVVAFWLAADSESVRSRLGSAYVWLFAFAALAIVVLVAAVVREAWNLLVQWRNDRPGSRLNARFALLICALAIAPAFLVSVFAIRFLDSGIDSWFRADVASSQFNAEALGREVIASFERRARDVTGTIARSDALLSSADPQAGIDLLVERISEPVYLSLYDQAGNLQAIGFNTSEVVLPAAPSEAERLQVRAAGQLAVSERINDVLVWRVLDRTDDAGVVQAIFPLPVDLAPRLDALERTAVDYAQLRFQRTAMKSTFILILGLVSLLALLGSLYAAFAATRRLIQPITELAVATAEIAEGKFGRILTSHSNDDIGFLTRGFNRMSSELLAADQRERSSRSEIEQNQMHLQAVLERLSAGVISFSGSQILTANPAAYALLDMEPGNLERRSLSEAVILFPRGAPLFELLARCAISELPQWREEILLTGEPARSLLVRGTRLGGEDQRFVSVFDDTAIIANSQREAAWAEVAKRLAHEIKNPLTPIQLAAERLRHKYLGKMNSADAEVLDRSTSTIVAQVNALKRIVNDFGDYTRPASGERRRFDVLDLLDEVAQLFEHSGQCVFVKRYRESPATVTGHRERIRQALINLFTNAIEASDPAVGQTMIELELERKGSFFLISIRDHGGGLPKGFDSRWFEPYNTTKAKGTGLGLATVKKVAEEHGGRIDAINADGHGACFIMSIAANPRDLP